MFTLLIADDEPLAQVGLKSMLDWSALDISIVGTSPNGLHAFDAIRRLRPDIVITDVRMPLLDGIGLLERCRAELDHCPEFIVLTGYGDFEGARRSLRCAAVDFLVKLELDEAALRESVQRAKAALLGKRASVPAPEAGPGRGDPFAETALTRLFSGSYHDSAEARASLAKNGIEIGAGNYRVALCKVDYPNCDRLSADERLRAYFCALDMMKELVGREMSIFVVPLDSSGFAALLSPRGEGEVDEDARHAIAALEQARELTGKYFGVALRVGISLARGDPGQAAASYREAERAAEMATDECPVVAYAGNRSWSGLSARADGSARRAAVAEAVAGASAESLRALADGALRDLASPETPASDALAICCEILYPILERQEDGESLLNSLFPGEAEGYRCLFSAGNAARMRAWLETVRDGLCARFESAQTRGRNPLVAGVRNYVLRNYAGKLTLGDVAARFRVSPNHLSSVFKKYNGAGFAEFVAQVKVEKAKELLRDGKYKMFEVAQLLGFDDAFYFSKVFKKIAGMSPSEYYLSSARREPWGESAGESADDCADRPEL